MCCVGVDDHQRTRVVHFARDPHQLAPSRLLHDHVRPDRRAELSALLRGRAPKEGVA